MPYVVDDCGEKYSFDPPIRPYKFEIVFKYPTLSSIVKCVEI